MLLRGATKESPRSIKVIMDGSLHAVQAGQVVPGGLTLAPPNSTFEMSPCREEEAEKLPNRENHSGRVGLYSEALYV